MTSQFIDRRLRETRIQVRLTDLGSSLMILTVGVLGFLLVVSILDHWVLDFGRPGRWVALILLLIGAIGYLTLGIVPLLFHRINPLYAARAIEEGTPALKNSLINFLQLRGQPLAVRPVVYQALEARAAADLASVPPEVAVDRSRLIRVGTILSAVLVLGACYKILSPKDPFQTVTRVAAPWADIARPARVEIVGVLPGDVTLYHGQTARVTAEIRGGGEDARVLYGTTDGQLVDVAVPMRQGESGLRYECVIPPTEAGAEQDLVYRVVAGDAESGTFQIRVSPAPSITVENLEYDFPDYARRENQTVSGSGDIRALEGTRVTIRARANLPIRSAYLELEPDAASAAGGRAPPRLPMRTAEDTAWRTITLQLETNRKTPRFAAYQLSFFTLEGDQSQRPIRYRIEVIPDLSPEVEILTPTDSRIELPVNGRQQIEARALDPDFGLRRVTLRAVAGGANILDRPLLDEPNGWVGQSVVKTIFTPAELGLEPGDRVTYWAVAADNREDETGSPAANEARTRSYHFLITPPRPAGSGTSDNRESPAESSASGDEAKGESGEGGEDGVAGSNAGDAGEKDAGENAGEGDRQGESSADAAGDEPSGESDTRGQQGGESGATGRDTQAGDGDSESSGARSGESDSSGQSDSSGGGSGESAGQEDPQSREESREPLHDGVVFERALEHLREAGSDSPERSGGDRRPENAPPKDPDAARATDGQPGADEDPESAGGESPNATGAPEDGQARPSPPDDSEPNTSDREGNQAPDGSNRPADAPREDAPRADQSGGDPSGSDPRGEAGAGRSSDKPSAAESDAENRDRPKQRQPRENESEANETGATTSDRQSDSEGASAGDQSGGGEEGAGQSANQPGRNSSGSNSPAEDGGGAAEQPGGGETSDAPGREETATGDTGQPGDESGGGSTGRSRPGGDQADGGERGADAGQQPPGERESPSSSQERGGERGGAAGAPTGGGVPQDGTASRAGEGDQTVAEGDRPNLEYAREATDLVLEYLSDQQDSPDQGLLDKLGWTPAELREFVGRWERLKRESPADASPQNRLDDRLRSLGLRRPEERLRRGNAQDDPRGGLRESAARSAPPAGYREQFEAFRKGRARVD